MGVVEDVLGSKRISNEGREAQSCQACAFKMGQPKVGEGPPKLLQAAKRVMPEGSKLGESKLRWLGKVGRSGKAAEKRVLAGQSKHESMGQAT